MSDWDDWPTQTSATAAKPSAPVSHNDDDWSPVDKKAPQGDDWESPPAPKANQSNEFSAAADEDDSEEITEMIEVEPGKVGRIIGSKGCVINEIKENHSVTIDVDKEENDNGKKEVKVTGMRSNVKAAIDEIKGKIEGGRPPRENNGSGDSKPSKSYEESDDATTETIMIDSGKVGKIVGAKGAIIQELQSNFEVKINISKEDDENCQRTVQVVGSEENIKKAMEEINNKLNSGGGMDSDKPRETYIPPDPTSDENEMFSNGISAGINFDKFDSIEVKVTENDGNPTKIKPIAKFEDAEIRSILLQNVEKAGYKRPTPIQKHAIPIIMAGRDLMGCAQTGSGKTCAFLLPILHGIMKHESSQLSCVIVAPTRELVIQIWTEALKFSHGSWVKVCRAYGGTQSSHQYNSIEKGCHVLVATPGRLSDFINRGYVNFSELKYLVLDEADRMLDMGFKEKIEEIANHSSFQKDVVQTLMFSATFPEDIQRLAWKFLKNYVFLAVGIVGGASSDVKQTVIEVEKFKKRGVLGDTLRELLKDSNRKVLVFVETKRTADFIACFMSDKKISSTSIHGDRLQREREIALNEFKSGKRKVLVATSVAARGLDIPQVTDVINYDLPKNIDDYVHRIGRTGRVGNEGSAISFYDSQTDSELRPHLARILKDAGQTVPEFLGAAGSSVFGGDSFGGVDIRGQAAGTQQGDDEDW